MGIFDAINTAESAMSVHRFRAEVAADNVANVYTPNYRRKEVDLQATNFSRALEGAGANVRRTGSTDAERGAVRVGSVHTAAQGPFNERQEALLATTELMGAKSAYELNVRSATLLKSMALSSLEIGRGS
jgi:flagellar basal body rod protein FlgC